MNIMSKKTIIICVVAVVAITVAGLLGIFVLRVDAAEAQRIALEATGGGEIVQQEVSNEGLWNEYSYTIRNENQWYEIDVGGFGHVEEMESGSGNAWGY